MAEQNHMRQPDDGGHVVYGLDYHKHGQGGGHHGQHHHHADPTAHRRQHHSQPAHHHHHHHHRDDARRRRTVTVVLCVVIALVVAVGVGAFALFRSAMGVASDAREVMGDLTTVEQALATGDAATAQATATSMASLAASMHEETGSPLWKVSSHLPVVGQDLYNVRILARAVDEVSQSVLVPVAQQAGSLSISKLVSDGTVDVATLQGLGETLATAAPQMQATTDLVDSGAKPGRIGAVNNALSQARGAIDQVNTLVQGVGAIGPHANQILGGDGQTRHYVVVAMGNSEIRAAGGFAGSYGLLTITNGKIELGDFESIQSHGEFNGVVATPDEVNYLGPAIGQMAPDGVPGDATFNPNFPRTCQFIIGNWNKVYKPDYTVDGVIAADPQFVQDMLAITGGVTTSDGATVDGTNAAKYLLSDVYWTWPNDGKKQDSAFSEVANLAFDKVIHGMSGSNLLQLGTTVGSSIRARDLNVWFADDDTELSLVGMGLANIIDDGTTGGSLVNPLLGIYYHDLTYGKIEWYLNAQTLIGQARQNPDGTKTYTVTTTLKNEMTADEAKTAPRYVLGQRYRGTDRDGTMAILVDFIAPAGGKIELESSTFDLEETTFMNRDVWRNIAEIAPQETQTVTYDVTVPVGAVSGLTLNTTPTCQKAAGWK